MSKLLIMLENIVYSDLVKVMMAFGANKVMQVFNHNQWESLTDKILNRMLQNAPKGLLSD